MTLLDESAASDDEPLSFVIGCDEQNCWVAIEAHGLCGGVFANEAAALKFVLEEKGTREGTVRFVKGVPSKAPHF